MAAARSYQLHFTQSHTGGAAIGRWPAMRFVRIVFGIIAGYVIGNVVGLVAAMGIDSSWGTDVAGSAYPMTLPNVIYALILGFLAGFFSSLIARWKNKGWLVGILSQAWAPLGLFLLMIVLNRAASLSDVLIWVYIGLIPAAIGGQLADELTSSEEATSVLGRLKWHWLWLWIPTLGCLYSLSGSSRFLINLFTVGWQVLLKPQWWILGFLGFDIVAFLLFLTFDIPYAGFLWLLAVLTEQDMKPSKRAGVVLLIAVGVPLLLELIWYINGLIMLFCANRGLKVY